MPWKSPIDFYRNGLISTTLYFFFPQASVSVHRSTSPGSLSLSSYYIRKSTTLGFRTVSWEQKKVRQNEIYLCFLIGYTFSVGLYFVPRKMLALPHLSRIRWKLMSLDNSLGKLLREVLAETMYFGQHIQFGIIHDFWLPGSQKLNQF